MSAVIEEEGNTPWVLYVFLKHEEVSEVTKLLWRFEPFQSQHEKQHNTVLKHRH